MTDKWPMKFVDDLHEQLSNAVLEELSRLKAPQYVFDLFYGVDFIYVYRKESSSKGSSLTLMEQDLTYWIQSSIIALTLRGEEEPSATAELKSDVSELDNSETAKIKTDLSSEMEDLCLAWVSRPAIPYQNMEEFLSKHQGNNSLPDFISTTTFKRALQLLGKAGKIQKSRAGRWKPTP